MERLVKEIIGTLLVLAIACCVFSCIDNERDPDRPLDLATDLTKENLGPFEEQAVHTIRGNEMHKLHFAGGAVCGVCHPTDQPMPIEQAHEICADCHSEQSVEKSVWDNHCLSCHHFTQASQEFESDPTVMMESLCAECHKGQRLGGSLYAASGHATSEMVLCDHCHRPHESDAPAAADLCATCHEELAEVRHPAGGKAKCSICHGAHRPPPDGTKLCTTCHGQADDVLVHKIPNHPKDCLECHNAHFTSIEIKGVCVDCHENRVYNGGSNQPAAHKNCENCHSLDDFDFKGSATCGRCHKEEGAIRFDDRIPNKHKRCTTCHPQHSWYASYKRNCKQCHDLENVREHGLEVHADTDCSQCHDPHQTADMTNSGQCATCHDSVPSFGRGAPEMHLACDNCHPDASERNFDFAGWDDTCKLCHFEALEEPTMEWAAVPSGHVECSMCHQAHSMKQVGVENSCAICHLDVADEAPNEMHGDCFNCHAQNHSVEFNGVSGSCDVCHSDVAGDAPNEMHADCFNCHAQDHSVEFAGVENSCSVCHGEPPGTHSGAGHQDCFTCHAQHSFTPDTSLCLICHSDKEAGHYYDPEAGADCIDCHTFSE